MATVELEELEIQEQESEDERVVAWRRERLGRAGYADLVALELALRRDVDLHQAVALVRDGCPPETARQILL